MKNRHSVWLSAGLILWQLGCVSPGSMDATVLSRYYRELAKAGPQQRGEYDLSDRDLGWLQPQPPSAGPQLQVDDGKVYLSLTDAVMRTLANNPSIRVVAYDPRISYQEMVRAAAAFDPALFASAGYNNVDTQGTATGFFSGSSEERTFEVGLRQLLPTGTSYSISWALTRNWNDFGASPRTNWAPEIGLEITQPLLRGVGPAFNLAQLRIARINHRISRQEFRQVVEQTIFDVYSAYWTLYRAQEDYRIQAELLKKTVETRDRMKARKIQDATEVEVKQAEAAVEQRNAALIRAQKAVRDARDALLRLMSDPVLNLTTSSDVQVVAISPLLEEAVEPDVNDQLLAALENSPILEQARQAIAIEDVNITIAENQLLPRLDLTASAGVMGRDKALHQAHQYLSSLDYVSYMLQLSFEYPLGNRARRADLTEAELRKSQARASLQNTADAVAIQVRERIRQIQTSYAEMQAQEKAVDAAQAQLDALNAREKLLGRLSPEFLNVKLQAQQTLASASQALVQARVNYNLAIVELAQVTGTILDWNQVQINQSVRDMFPAIWGDEPWPPHEAEMPARPEVFPENGQEANPAAPGDEVE